MNKKFFGRSIIRFLCLLFTVGILLIWRGDSALATDLRNIDLETNLERRNEAGTTENSTTIRNPGEATTPEELAELNIANTVSITYQDNNGTVAGALRILITLTLIGLAPILLLTMTCFTRIIIVMHFTRAALSTQTAPPNQILIGLSLILTFFIMQPTLTEIYTNAVLPFEQGTMDQEEALKEGLKPLRQFMYGQTQTKDVRMFMEISNTEWDGETLENIPTPILIPSFMISELRTAFIIGFLIYIPFIVIDMVVASTLMSMGMMMLPPTVISMPFKILLFVLADGWNLIIGNLVRTFY